MGFLSAITSVAGSLLGRDTIKDVGKIIDNLHTSGEEKEEARQKITEILAKAELEQMTTHQAALQIAKNRILAAKK